LPAEVEKTSVKFIYGTEILNHFPIRARVILWVFQKPKFSFVGGIKPLGCRQKKLKGGRHFRRGWHGLRVMQCVSRLE
jgi:hypothetical protein